MGISSGAGDAASKVDPAYLAIESRPSEEVEGVTVEPVLISV